MAILKAPWSFAQVEALNDFQADGQVHPFTCGNRDVPRRDHPDGKGVLTAFEGGWRCLHCGYEQDWCHDWMATWTPKGGAT